jgi:CDP-glycerol glycerophosphotransferase (TagB/SpsB family)
VPRFLKSLLAPVFRLFAKELVVFLETHRGSGSNVFAMYADLVANPSLPYQCQLVRRSDKGFWNGVRRELLLAQAKWIIQDHGGRRRYPGQKVIELWHGIPLKTMDLMDSNDSLCQSPVRVARSLPDFVISSSRMYETLLSACRCVPARRYRRFGFPRLRWLKTDRAHARRLLGEAVGQAISEEEKLILWVPTHRRMKSNSNGNGHGYSVIPALLEKYLNEDLEQTLHANNMRLILKPHPNDEAEARELIEERDSRIKLLTSDAIDTETEDLYRLLPGSDALITDYSSIYFDYLLLDKPIAFVLDDLEQYRGERGFLLEPVTEWMPGHQIRTPDELDAFLRATSNEEDSYTEQRAKLRETFYPEGIQNTANLIRDHILK